MKQDLIYKMLFSEEKVELSSEKVELAGVKDLQRALSVSKKVMGRAEKSIEDYETAKRNALNEVRGVGAEVSAIREILSDVKDAAKELGLNPESIKEYKELLDVYDKMFDFANNYEKKLK